MQTWTVVLVLCLLASWPAHAKTKLALVIGNSAYAQMGALPNPANDAKLVSGSLKGLGFEVTALTDQTQAQMKTAVSNFARSIDAAGPDTIAMFYYAGHGVQIDGTNYLVPIDAGANSAADIVLGGIAVADLLKTLELARANVNVMVLDACRNNPFPAGTRSIARGLARVDAPNGSLIAYATAPGQIALDGDTANSPYAEALARNLNLAGLPLEAVFRNVRIEVSEKTKGTQVPWEETSLTQEVVLVAGEKPKPEPVVEPPKIGNTEMDTARAYLLAVGQNSIEGYDQFLRQFPAAKETQLALRNLEMLNDEANWRRAEEQNTPGAYRIYMNLHPQGGYVGEAANRLANLQPAPPPTPSVKADPPPFTPMIETNGFDLYGDDGEVLRDVSFSQCTTACANNQSCAAATYRADLSRCYTKTSVSLLVRNQKVAVAIKPAVQANVRTVQFEILPQADFPGFDIANTKSESTQTCLLMCEARTDCKAFAYTTKTKTCWMKGGYGAAVAAPPVVSGFRVE